MNGNFKKLPISLSDLIAKLRKPGFDPELLSPLSSDLNSSFKNLPKDIVSLGVEVARFSLVTSVYFHKRLVRTFLKIEKSKNWLKKWLMWRRGLLFRPATHGGVVMLSVIAVALGSIFGGSDIEAQSISPTEGGLLIAGTTSQTIIPENRVRSEIIDHTISSGDTLSSIARKYDVNVESIEWLNKVINVNDITPGDVLKIPPVSGVVHKVKSGDSIESVAKRYGVNSQNIANYPFNYLDDSFELKIGQDLVVPDGTPPATPKPKPVQPSALANGNTGTKTSPSGSTAPTGRFLWPVQGEVSQTPSWYHMAFDIANSSLPPVQASDGGTVVSVQYLRYGYGYHVIIDHGNGYQTLYAHLSRIYVSDEPGKNRVSKGQTIGQVGTTGRSTGPHLHFEVRQGGTPINPSRFF